MKLTRRGSSHGNFHFYSNDYIKLEKSGSFIIYFKGLRTVHERILRKHLRNSSGGIIHKYLNSKREWEEFNRSIQSVIDNKLRELDE